MREVSVVLPGGMEFLIILAIIIILFGAKKIPDLAKGISTGIKEFKKGMKGDEKKEIQDNSDSEDKD